MCIIAAKPAGTKMPSDETIDRMWYRNNDGAGIMYAVDGKVKIDKGFMKLADFKAHLDNIRKKVDLDSVAVVMHFRITTHGGTCPENCHPFPIARSIKALKTLHQSCPIGIAHNGIIPNSPRKGISDTMEYIISQLAPLYDMNHSFVKNKAAMELVKNAIGSKMAFLTGSGEIYLIGDFVEDEGIKYSNTSYKPYEYTSKFYGGVYGGWSFYEDAPFDSDGKYADCEVEEIPLMWCGFLQTGSYYTIDGENDLRDDYDDLLIDEEGHTYVYDWDSDLAVPMPNFHVFESSGRPARFDPDEADLEPVGSTYDELDDWKDIPAGNPS